MSERKRLFHVVVILCAAVSGTCDLTGPGPGAPRSVSCDQLAEEFERHPLPSRVAGRMCRKHLQDVCVLTPPRPMNAVCPAGGEPAGRLEFPHMALLGYGPREKIEFACGGSLISPDFVLTAAHCIAKDEQPVRWVLLGAANRSTAPHPDPPYEPTRQLLEVAEAIGHPEYRPPRKYNDVALLRLAAPARLEPRGVVPACLATDMDGEHTGREAVATGWGATGFAEEGSERLIKVRLTVRDLQFCKDRVRPGAAAAPEGLLDSHLCAGGGDDGGRDTCQGDSGGPLQVPVLPSQRSGGGGGDGGETCLFRILGVVSFGPPCGLGRPGVYSRVAAFVPWIEDIVWPLGNNESCAQPDQFRDSITSDPTRRPVAVLDSGPGTRARRMCRFYLGSFCHMDGYISSYMQPGLKPSDQCHHQFSGVAGKDTDFRFGNSSTATLLYGEDFLLNEEYACSGSLVSPQFLLTAAHCAKLGCLPVTMVRLGKPHSCIYYSTLYRVSSVHVHPAYDPALRYNDVALVKLLGRLDWELTVDIGLFLPVCLHAVHAAAGTGGDLTTRTDLLAEGWQAHGRWDDLTYDFVSRDVSVCNRSECESSLEAGSSAGGWASRLPQGMNESQICTGGLCGGGRYPGNPGSPLLAPMFTLWQPSLNRSYPVRTLVGVEALTPPCGPQSSDLPDVFTAVSPFLPWIEGIVWPEETAHNKR